MSDTQRFKAETQTSIPATPDRVADWRTSAQSLDETQKAATSMGDSMRKTQQKVADMAEQHAPQLKETFDKTKEDVKATFGEQKTQAADRLGGVASALRQTSSDLQSQDQQAFAQYIDEAAGQIDKFSNYLRDKNVSEIFNDVQGMARRQPELFVAGALAAGFLVGRFLKSSSAQSQSRQSYRSDYDYRTNYDYGRSDYVDNLYGGRPQSGGAWSASNAPSGQNIPISNVENDYGRTY